MSYNITIDDPSPLLQYISLYADASTGWQPNTTADPFTIDYFKDSFYGTYGPGDFMSFTFNGTAIYVYGAKRPNHGDYTAQIDGGEIVTQNGIGPNPGAFQQLLFSAEELSSSSEHNLIMTNAPASPSLNWFDIDYIIVTIDLPNSLASEPLYTTAIDDTSPQVTYSGQGWSRGPPIDPQDYYNGTAHITNVVGDYLTLDFTGTSVELLGGLYKDHGNYSISLDGVNQPHSYNGTYWQIQPQTTLFIATQLVDGPHSVTLTCVGDGPLGTYLDFDYAVVNSSINPYAVPSGSTSTSQSGTTSEGSGSTGSTSALTATVSGSSSSSTSGFTGSNLSGGKDPSGTSTAGIAGGVIGGLAALAAILGLAFYFLRRKRKIAIGQEKDYSYPSGQGMNDSGEITEYRDHPNSYPPKLDHRTLSDRSISHNHTIHSGPPGLLYDMPNVSTPGTHHRKSYNPSATSSAGSGSQASGTFGDGFIGHRLLPGRNSYSQVPTELGTTSLPYLRHSQYHQTGEHSNQVKSSPSHHSPPPQSPLTPIISPSKLTIPSWIIANSDRDLMRNRDIDEESTLTNAAPPDYTSSAH